ncbi:MAG: hypothetical protein ACX94B_10945 [Henriciella sp.]|nr:hypothetical protein [Hyphomonadaceae bacterium]
MSETSRTKGWFTLGLSLIIIGGAVYALGTVFGVFVLVQQSSEAAGAPIWPILLIPGLVGLGFLVLLAKVIVDRLNNAEDDHYSRTVDK